MVLPCGVDVSAKTQFVLVGVVATLPMQVMSRKLMMSIVVDVRMNKW